MAEAAFRHNNTLEIMAGHRWAIAIAGPLVALIIAMAPARADQHLVHSKEFIRSLADRAIDRMNSFECTVE